MKAVLGLLLSAVSLASAITSPERVSYDGYKAVRVAVGDDASRVTDLIDRMSLQVWKGIKKGRTHVDVVVAPDQLSEFEDATADLDTLIMHTDLGASIKEEANFEAFAGVANATWFNSFHTWADHLKFINDLHTQYPDNTKVVTSGTTNGGRAITGLQVFGKSGAGVKPGIILHSTVHAREWIATMVNEYILYELLTGYGKDTTVTGFVDSYDFFIFPVVNVDGFIYTQTTNRLWRKNRQTNTGASCAGIDINRNWPYVWNVAGGASTDPCAEDYRGAAQGDATETNQLATYIKNIKTAQGLKMYIDFHSYSQLFMTPYGYSCTAVATNNSKFQSLAKGFVAALKAVSGTVFDYGPICTTIYQVSGDSVDYVNDVIKADYTFTSELRDTGTYGFVLPANQILPSGKEVWAGMKWLMTNF